MAESRAEFRHFVEARYAGQDFSMPVPSPPGTFRPAVCGDDRGGVQRDSPAPVRLSRRRRSRSNSSMFVWRRSPAASIRICRKRPVRRRRRALVGSRRVSSRSATAAVDCPVYQREHLAAGRTRARPGHHSGIRQHHGAVSRRSGGSGAHRGNHHSTERLK